MYCPATLPEAPQTTSSAKRPDHSRLSSPAGLTRLIQEAAERRRHPGKKLGSPQANWPSSALVSHSAT
jgi:hypothetical protein